MPTVYIHDFGGNVTIRGPLLALPDGVRKIRKRAAQTGASMVAASTQRATRLAAKKGR